MRFGPGFWSDLWYLMVGRFGQTGENVAEIGVGIEVSPPAAFDEAIEDGAALAPSSFPTKSQFFLLMVVG